MTSDLKPCPFCGSDAKYAKRENRNLSGWSHEIDHWVFCDGDDCLVHMGMGETKEEVVQMWNARAALGETAMSDRTKYHYHRDDCDFKFAPLDVCDCVEKNMEDALAELREALKPLIDHAVDRAADAPEWNDSDTVQITIEIGDLRRAAALGKEG